MPNQTTDNTYSEKLKDPRWQRKRLEIFQRDNWTCQKCEDTKSPLVVHHRFYLLDHEHWDYPDDLLVTLCERCHNDYFENIKAAESIILQSLKRKFFIDELYTLAVGLDDMVLQASPRYVASAYSWAFSNDEIQQILLEKHAQLMERVVIERKQQKAKDGCHAK